MHLDDGTWILSPWYLCVSRVAEGLFCQQLAEHGLQCSVDGGPVQWMATSEDDGEYQADQG